MSNKWLSSGRYQITRGVLKRLWQKKPSLSVVMIPNVVREKEGAPASQKLLTQSGQPLLTESGMEILLN